MTSNHPNSPGQGDPAVSEHPAAPPASPLAACLEDRRFRALVEASLDAIALLDARGTLIYTSPSRHRVLGYPAGELDGENMLSYVHPADLPRVTEVFSMLASQPGATATEQYRFRHKDGSWRWIEARAHNLLHDPDVAAVVTHYRDISEKKGEEERFRSHLLDAVEQAVIAVDRHAVITYWNRFAAQLYGWTREEALGRNIMELVPEDLRTERRYLIRERIRGGESFSGELPVCRSDGSVFLASVSAWPIYDSEGALNGIVTVSADITRQKEMEESLRFLLAHARCILWHSEVRLISDGLFDWDFHIFDEDAALRFLPFDLQPGETYTEVWNRSKLPEDVERMDKVSREVLLTGQSHYEQVFRCRCRGGELRWLYEQTHIEPLGPGRWRLAGVCTDITDRKRVEQELNRTVEHLTQVESELRHANIAKDQFLAMLAHELRNPLAAILNAARLLQLRTAADSSLNRSHEILERQVHTLARLVDDLLDVSRITQGKIELRREVLNLIEVVERAVEAVRPIIAQRFQALELSLPSSPVLCAVDPTRVEQIISNLLTNASKYTENGGHIWLRVECHPQDVEIRVRDNGTGIEADLLPHVFDLFTQGEHALDRTSAGLGIGLTLVKSLAAMHGGTVEAHSPGPGLGSDFVVRLPLASDGVPSADGSARISGPGRLRILIVDDNADAAEMLGQILEVGGHQIRIADDGPAALAQAREFQPEVVLLDIGLPGMSGYEVAATLRQDPENANLRLFAITGYGQQDDRDRSRQAGFDLHLTKPVDPDDLQRLLAGVSERWASGRVGE